MEKEIILPWSCETSRKIEEILFQMGKWAILILSPVIAVFSLTNYFGYVGQELFPVFIIITAIVWIIQIAVWDERGKILHLKFKCKQQNDREVKS